MPKGVYERTKFHKHCGFQRGHKINLGKPSPLIGRKCSQDHIEKVRQSRLGRTCSLATRLKISQAHLGMRPSEETRRKLVISHLKVDGKSPSNQRFYWSSGWIRTRNNIYAMDNYLCQECGKRCSTRKNEDRICCHHIDYNINNNEQSNLITLCASCHTKTNYTRKDWTEHFRLKKEKQDDAYGRPAQIAGVCIGNNTEDNLLNSGNPKSKDMAILSEILSGEEICTN